MGVIPYHGTPIGGTRQDVVRFLQGRHALVSFHRPDDLPAVMDVCKTFVLDNGAFSHWKAGKGDIDVLAYQEWAESLCHHPGYEWCLIPDKIDCAEEENRKLVIDWMRTGSRANGVPVWHLHESLEYLEWLVSRFNRVALGSSGQWSTPGTANWWRRMGEVMRVACYADGKPRTKLHGLRMLDPEIFTRLPLASADSTNAAVNCGSLSRFGSYKPPTAAQRAAVIAERIEAHQSAAVWIGIPEQTAMFGA